jgi:uncharacterized membrane protein YkvA (DUF1232 family)
MNNNTSPSNLQDTAGFLGGLVRQARLGWRLLRDSRVPGWVKMIPAVGLIYFLSPIDIIPDWVLPGLGELDDLVVIVLALKMFVDLSPPGVVREHVEDLLGRRKEVRPAEYPSDGPTIDASYRVLDETARPRTETENP